MKNAGIASTVVLGIFALVIGMVVLNGVMLSYMWQWFVVPLGVRTIGAVQAIGIAIIVSVLTYKGDAKGDDSSEALNKMLLHLGARIVTFGIAFGLSFLMPA
jgi:hypothetical protein